MKKILNSYKSSFQTNFSNIKEGYELIYILGVHVCYLSIFKVDFQAIFKQRMNEEVLDFLPMDDTDIEKELHTMVKNHLKNLLAKKYTPSFIKVSIVLFFTNYNM